MEVSSFSSHHPSKVVSSRDLSMGDSETYPKEFRAQTSTASCGDGGVGYGGRSGRSGRSSGGNQSVSNTTSVHVMALDGLVNVNALFTIAIFVGLALTTPHQHSLDETACDASIEVIKMLLVFEVVSFSFFLFSSLVAQGLKLAVNLLNSRDADEVFRAHINIKVLRFGMMGSALGSVMGCLFLMLSMVNVVQIRLGRLSCGSQATVYSVAALIVLVSSALLVYITTTMYAFMH